MAKRKRKAKAKASNWRSCDGVNSRTGRIKKGYRPRKGGGCPVPARKK